jgi:hypothetical protein
LVFVTGEQQLSHRRVSRRVVAVLAVLALMVALPVAALAEQPANEYFERTWERTDQQVSTGDVTRTWIWGPSGFTASCKEPYFKTNAGEREVQYFDKSRMEITDPLADRDSEWYVTQGLLATEMITGQMQVGDDEYLDWGPADVHIAGDEGGGSPSYAHFAQLMDAPALGEGAAITQTLDSAGNVGDDQALADYGVTAQEYVPDTEHRVASVFWDFMNSQGSIIENGVATSGPMFANPFYAVGFPLTEAFWTNVEVDGVAQDVLVQAFQRRVLTYTPGNDDGWQVEAGNVGQHYYIWRYGEIPADSGDACPDAMHVTFNVYEPAGEGQWDRIAVTTTREVWHPEGVATGTWASYIDDGGEVLPRNSAGILRADHSYRNVSGVRILSSLNASITQIEGPTGGTAQIDAGGFDLGSDPRVQNSIFTGTGSMDWDTGTQYGTLNFEVAGTGTSTFHVFLDGPAPPVFFQ